MEKIEPTTKDLFELYPEACNRLIKAAIDEEHKRLKGIDDLPKVEGTEEIIKEAKYVFFSKPEEVLENLLKFADTKIKEVEKIAEKDKENEIKRLMEIDNLPKVEGTEEIIKRAKYSERKTAEELAVLLLNFSNEHKGGK